MKQAMDDLTIDRISGSAMFALHPDGILLFDGMPNGRVHDTNLPAARMLGYTRDELIGLSPEALTPPDLWHRYQARRAERSTVGGYTTAYVQHRDGHRVPVEVAFVPTEVGDSVLAYVRELTDGSRVTEQLLANDELVILIAAGADVDSVTQRAADRLREELDADTVMVVLPGVRHEMSEICALSGMGHPKLVGLAFEMEPEFPLPTRENSLIEMEDGRAEPYTIPSFIKIGLGPGLLVAIPQNLADEGFLMIGRLAGRPAFSAEQRWAAIKLAITLGVGLDLLAARSDTLQEAVLAEQERIARDLHDTVIQALFAEGLQIESIAHSSPPETAAKLHASTVRINTVMDRIRTAIEGLARLHESDTALRDAIIETADAIVAPAGLRTRVRIDHDDEAGDIDDLITPEARTAILAVVSEAVSNAARHSGGRTIEVVVTVNAQQLSVIVADDGQGVPDRPSAGSGLVSLQARALQLGGTFTLRNAQPSGAVAQWTVPTPLADVDDIAD
jgi:two-component system, NarL family, sensor histidine kinase DevS